MEIGMEIGMVGGGCDFQCSNGRRHHHERELVGGGREELRGAW